MCIGIPMQVVSGDALFAECERVSLQGTERERLDMRLVGALPAGSWVLAFHGAARRVLEAQEAAQMTDALHALHAALEGDGDRIDALFADLIDREPQLPPHLVAAKHTPT